jgi:Nickel responsive protein SCO4226-like
LSSTESTTSDTGWTRKEGKIFCLVEAPDAETAHRVHREAHGLVADEIYEIQEGE